MVVSPGPDLASLGAAVASTIGPDDRATPVRAALAAGVTSTNQFEASVRRDDRGGFRGGRIMIEASPLELVGVVAGALGIEVPPLLARLAATAAAEAIPLICGWDTLAPSPQLKLYVNCSDAAVAVRRRMVALSGLHPPDALAEPNVIGVNVGEGGAIEHKLYLQAPDPQALAEGLGPAARDLARRAPAVAGAVASWDCSSDGGWCPRAFFLAFRNDRADEAEALLATLPGWSREGVAAALPFPPGPPRSLGLALADPSRWTLYYKPAGDDTPVALLDPVAIFRAGAVEVGLFLDPTERAPRAFARTARHALSLRVREGAPNREDLERLMSWAARSVRAAELAGLPPVALLGDPPPPWRREDDRGPTARTP